MSLGFGIEDMSDGIVQLMLAAFKQTNYSIIIQKSRIWREMWISLYL